jgi:hypothetical protein
MLQSLRKVNKAITLIIQIRISRPITSYPFSFLIFNYKKKLAAPSPAQARR